MAPREARLECREGTSDKVYNLRVEPHGLSHRLVAEWGRRGARLTVEPKFIGAEEAANAKFDRLVKEKYAKGYRPIAGAAAPAVPVGRERLNQTAWLPGDMTEQQVTMVLESREWCAQEKRDGMHLFAHRLASVVATNRKGEVKALNPEIAAALAPLPLGTLVDGELIHGGPFVAFDLLSEGEVDLRSEGYSTRWDRLRPLVKDLKSPLVELVAHAEGPAAKRRLRNRLLAEHAEGVIYKRLDARYVPGRPQRGSSMLREKWRRRADVIAVRRKTDETASFDLYVMENGKPRQVGACSAQKFFHQVAQGKAVVLEVKYQYATADMKLISAAVQHIREDKSPDECTIDQLVVGKRYGGKS